MFRPGAAQIRNARGSATQKTIKGLCLWEELPGRVEIIDEKDGSKADDIFKTKDCAIPKDSLKERPSKHHKTMTDESIPKTERTWALAAHLSALCTVVVPFGHIIAPLVIWLIKKEEMPFVDDQAKEALNFQISVSIYAIVAAFLIIVVVGFLLLIAVGVFWLIFIIIAAIKANDGEPYRYPLCIRFL